MELDPDPGRDPDPDPYLQLVDRGPDPGVPETRGSGGSGPEFGSGSATLAPGMGGGGGSQPILALKNHLEKIAVEFVPIGVPI